MKYFWSTLSISCFVIPSVMACTLPKGKELVIGCSYQCDPFYRLRLQYTAWKLGYELKIVSMPDEGKADKALSLVHGVLAPGGADIDPYYYSTSVTPGLKKHFDENRHLVKFSEEGKARDPYEFALVTEYSTNENYKDLPLLGICRGMQMMTVAAGIPLYLDLKAEAGIDNRNYDFDQIQFEKSPSKISRIYASDVSALEIHHQGLRVPYWREHQDKWPNVKVTAFSHDGKVAEVIEYQNRPAIGVQYHPEKSLPGTSEPILQWLLTKSCEYRNSLKDVL